MGFKDRFLTVEEIDARKNSYKNRWKRAKSKANSDLRLSKTDRRNIRMEEKGRGSKLLVDTSKMLTERQDLYCYHRAMGAGRRVAYFRAGYSSENYGAQEGYKMEQNEKIKERIEEYKQQISDQRAMGHDQILARFEHLYDLALEAGDVKTAAGLLEKISNIAGFVYKVEGMTGLEKKKTFGQQYIEVGTNSGLQDFKLALNPMDNLKRMKELLVKDVETQKEKEVRLELEKQKEERPPSVFTELGQVDRI